MAGTRSSSNLRSTGATRQRASSTRDATPTRSSARQREKKKAKSGDVLSTVAKDDVVVDGDVADDVVVNVDVADDDDITPPPLVQRTNGTTDNRTNCNTFPSDSVAVASNVASDGR
jgi:hypothetical protein